MSYQLVLSELLTKIDIETYVSDWFTVDQSRVNAFAEATLDKQWIHVDPERAHRESPFGGPVAHGYLTLSLMPYLAGSVTAERPRFPGSRLSVNYGLNRVRFPHPLVVGGRIRVRSRLVSVEEIKDNVLQIINLYTMEIEGAVKPACVAETVARIYF
ncbi:MAG: MaoC family dehydratase [Gammaproteobacteria bacterium]|nr:MaoC family dehydratase [Gammaproteobacteria bacterium]